MACHRLSSGTGYASYAAEKGGDSRGRPAGRDPEREEDRPDGGEAATDRRTDCLRGPADRGIVLCQPVARSTDGRCRRVVGAFRAETGYPLLGTRPQRGRPGKGHTLPGPPRGNLRVGQRDAQPEEQQQARRRGPERGPAAYRQGSGCRHEGQGRRHERIRMRLRGRRARGAGPVACPCLPEKGTR